MTTATSTPIPTGKVTPKVEFRTYEGTRASIIEQLEHAVFPGVWGAAEVIRAYAKEHIPLGPKWQGSITITGYRTPPADNGTGTTYLSVTWKPNL